MDRAPLVDGRRRDMQTFVAKFAVVLAAVSVGAFLRSTGLFNKQDARVRPHCLKHTKLDRSVVCRCTAISAEMQATMDGASHRRDLTLQAAQLAVTYGTLPSLVLQTLLT